MKPSLSQLFTVTIVVCILTTSTSAWPRSARHWPNLRMWFALATAQARAVSGLDPRAGAAAAADSAEEKVPSAEAPAATATVTAPPTTLPAERTAPDDALDERTIESAVQWLEIWDGIDGIGGSPGSWSDVGAMNAREEWIVKCVVIATNCEAEEPPVSAEELAIRRVAIAMTILQDPSNAHPNAGVHARIVEEMGTRGQLLFVEPMGHSKPTSLAPGLQRVFIRIAPSLRVRGR